jgi:zinc transporter ZupT
VPEGLALGALLLGAGFAPGRTIQLVAAVEATTLLGGVLGHLFLPSIGTVWLDAIVAHVGGGFVFLAAHAVFGEIVKHHKALVVANFVAGLGAIGLIAVFLRTMG